MLKHFYFKWISNELFRFLEDVELVANSYSFLDGVIVMVGAGVTLDSQVFLSECSCLVENNGCHSATDSNALRANAIDLVLL